MLVNLGLLQVESEAISEHFPEVREETPDAGVLLRVLLVQHLLDDVQRDGLLDLVEVGGEVEVGAVTEGDRLRSHVVHLEQQPPAELQIPLTKFTSTFLDFVWKLKT